MRIISRLLLLIIIFSACSSEEENPDTCSHTNQNLSGFVLDKAFNLQVGEASFDQDGNEYQVFLFGDDEITIDPPCTSSALDYVGTQVTFFFAAETGERTLGGTKLVTLYNAESNTFEVSNTGCYEITSISENTIAGKITLMDDTNRNAISGNWEATICP